jgi:hypothetical protein
MRLDEVMRLSDRDAITRTGNRHPMRLAKSYYDKPPRAANTGSLGMASTLEFTASVGSLVLHVSDFLDLTPIYYPYRFGEKFPPHSFCSLQRGWGVT